MTNDHVPVLLEVGDVVKYKYRHVVAMSPHGGALRKVLHTQHGEIIQTFGNVTVKVQWTTGEPRYEKVANLRLFKRNHVVLAMKDW